MPGIEWQRRPLFSPLGVKWQYTTLSTADTVDIGRVFAISGSSSTSVYTLSDPIDAGLGVWITCISATSSQQANVRPSGSGVTFQSSDSTSTGLRELAFQDSDQSVYLVSRTTSKWMILLNTNSVTVAGT